MPLHPTLASKFKCPLCGHAECHRVKFPRSDGSGRVYISQIYQCVGCTVIFADPDRFMYASRS